MKLNILLFSLICAGIILLSLILPYELSYYKTTVPAPNGFIDDGREVTYGWYYFPWSLIPALVILLIAGWIKIKQNLATAIIGLVLSVINLLYMAFLAFILTFSFSLNFFGPAKKSEVALGYYISLLVVFSYIALMLIHLIVVIRNRRNPVKSTPVDHPDLLDSEF